MTSSIDYTGFFATDYAESRQRLIAGARALARRAVLPAGSHRGNAPAGREGAAVPRGQWWLDGRTEGR